MHFARSGEASSDGPRPGAPCEDRLDIIVKSRGKAFTESEKVRFFPAETRDCLSLGGMLVYSYALDGGLEEECSPRGGEALIQRGGRRRLRVIREE